MDTYYYSFCTTAAQQNRDHPVLWEDTPWTDQLQQSHVSLSGKEVSVREYSVYFLKSATVEGQ